MKKYKYSKNYFDKYGSAKVNYASSGPNPTFKKIINEFHDLGTSKGKILDIGCAQGYFLKECQDKFDVYGIDISTYIVKLARKLLSSNKIYSCDLTQDKLPFKSNFFDVVTMLDSLEHIENPQNALREVHKVLKRKGLFHVRLPGFNRGLAEPTHVNFYNTTSLKVLLEKHGYKIIKLGEEGGRLQVPLGVIRLIKRGNTNFNYVPFGGKFISCYLLKA